MQRKSHKGDVLLDGKSEVVIMDGIVIMNVRDEIISVQWKAIGEAVEQYEPTTDGRSYHTEDIQVYTTTCKGRVIREMYYLMESPK